MNGTIHYVVNMDDLTQIESALGMMKDKSKMVLRTAINNTAKQVEQRMSKETKQTYRYKNVRVSDIREANTIKKAKTSNLVAIIEARGTPNELLDFRVRPNNYFPGGKGAPEWVKAKGRADTSLKEIAREPESEGDKYKGFVVRFKNGHLAMVERVPGKHMRNNPQKEAIEALYSIATPKMEEVVYLEKVDEDVEGLLMRNIQEQIQRYMR